LCKIVGLVGREAALQEEVADAAAMQLVEPLEARLGIAPRLDQLDKAPAGIVVGGRHPLSLSDR
jgi:hypothetical protein